MLLSVFGFQKNRFREGRTVLSGANGITSLRVLSNRVTLIVTERIGTVCVLLSGVTAYTSCSLSASASVTDGLRVTLDFSDCDLVQKSGT